MHIFFLFLLQVDTTQYWTYLGGLTTPPCTVSDHKGRKKMCRNAVHTHSFATQGAVTWVVFKDLPLANGAKTSVLIFFFGKVPFEKAKSTARKILRATS